MYDKIVEMALSGLIGNATYDFLKKIFLSKENNNDKLKIPIESLSKEESKKDGKEIESQNRKFITFDIDYDLENIMSLMTKPVVYYILEDKPSTAWHLPLIVIEDKTTSEWYVFSKGRMALEGSGGGLFNSKRLFKFLLKEKIPFSGWVLNYSLSEKLIEGKVNWFKIKNECIPMLTYSENEYIKNSIVETFKELAIPNKSLEEEQVNTADN